MEGRPFDITIRAVKEDRVAATKLCFCSDVQSCRCVCPNQQEGGSSSNEEGFN